MKLLTNSPVVISILRPDSVDVHLAVVAVPVDVRHIAVKIASCVLSCSILITNNFLQNYLCWPIASSDLFRRRYLTRTGQAVSVKWQIVIRG